MIIRGIFLCSFLVFFAACTSLNKKTGLKRHKATPDAVALFNSVDLDLEAGNSSSALRKLQQIVRKYPKSDIADDAHMKLGEIYFSAKQYRPAIKNFVAVYQSQMNSPLYLTAKIKASRAMIFVHQFNKAIEVTTDVIENDEPSEAQLTQVYKIRLDALSESGEKYETLKSLAYLSTQHPGNEKRSSYRALAIEMVETQMDDHDLEKIGNSTDFGFLRSYALLRKGELYKERKMFAEAKSALLNLQELVPSSDLADRATLILQQIEALKKVDPMTIGAILPLTGKHSKVAHRVLRGLQLGLGIYGNNTSNFKLAIVDSEGNPDIARRAVERLVTEDHAIAIVGSLLSKTSVAVASKCHELGVTSIGLSQKIGITETGDSVFRNWVTTEMQVKHLVKTSVNDLGMKKFAILYPNEGYGVALANQFWDEVLRNGGEIRAVQTYDPKETDFRNHVQRLVGTYFVGDRLREYEIRLKQWADKQTRRSAREHAPEDLLPPIVDFDAIFIPDSPKKLGQIVPMLNYNDVEKIVLLGTNIWNTPNLPSRINSTKFPTLFVDGYFSNDQKLVSSLFWKEFVETFREEPTLFEIHAYDTGLLLRQLVLSGANTREALTAQLKTTVQFPGALGGLVVNSQREFERPLISLTLKNGKISKLDVEALKQFVTPPPEEPKPGQESSSRQ